FDVNSYLTIRELLANLSTHEITIASDGTKEYITENSSPKSNIFCIFDPITMKLSKKVETPLLLLPYSVVISPDGKYAYMSGYNSDNILRIDTRTDSIISNLPLGPDVEIPV